MRILYRYLYMPRVKDDWHKIWVFNQQEDNGEVNVYIHVLMENFAIVRDAHTFNYSSKEANVIWKALIKKSAPVNPQILINLITQHAVTFQYDNEEYKVMQTCANTSSTNMDFLNAYLKWVNSRLWTLNRVQHLAGLVQQKYQKIGQAVPGTESSKVSGIQIED